MVDFLPDAAAELSEAAAYYEGRERGLGSRFLDCVGLGVEAIDEMPLSAGYWPSLLAREYGVRRLVLREFPFTLVYVTEPALVIIAVAHTKRRPDYWVVRLQRIQR